MKLIKTAFLIALLNFFIMGAMVLALKKPETKDVTVGLVVPTAAPVVTQTSPTQIPTSKPRVAVAKPVADPFSIIFSEKLPTPAQGGGQVQGNPQPNSQINSPTTAPAAPVADSRCLISIDGVGYDISVFQNQHSGGNIFKCGSDMSASFHNQHPNSFLQKMAKYKV